MKSKPWFPAVLVVALAGCDEGRTSTSESTAASPDAGGGGADTGSGSTNEGGTAGAGNQGMRPDDTAEAPTATDTTSPTSSEDPNAPAAPDATTSTSASDSATAPLDTADPSTTPDDTSKPSGGDSAGGAGGNDGLGGSGGRAGEAAGAGGSNDPGSAGAGGSPPEDPAPILFADSGVPPDQVCPPEMTPPVPPITLDATLKCYADEGLSVLAGKEPDTAYVGYAVSGEGAYLAQVDPSGVTFDALGYLADFPVPFFEADGSVAMVANVGSPVGMALWQKAPNWWPETIIAGYDAGYGFDAPLARAVFLGTDGEPRVFYSSSQVIARSADSTWTSLETPPGHWSGLVVDSTGRVHIIYQEYAANALEHWVDGTILDGTSTSVGLGGHPATAINATDTIAILANLYSRLVVLLADDNGFSDPIATDAPALIDGSECYRVAYGGTCEAVSYTREGLVATSDGAFWIGLIVRHEDFDFEYVDGASGGLEVNVLEDRSSEELRLIRMPGDGSEPASTRWTMPLEYGSSQRFAFTVSGSRLYVGIGEAGDAIHLIGVDWTQL